MALDPKIVAKLKKDLAEINKIYKQIGQDPLKIDFDDAGIDDIKLVRDYLSEAKVLVADIEDGFGGMAESIKNIVGEWKSGFADPTKEATKSFSKLKGLAEKFSNDTLGIVEMKGKEVAKNYELINQEVEKLKKLKGTLTKKAELLGVGEKLSDNEQTILNNLNSEYKVQEEMLGLAKTRLEEEQKISKAMGLSGAAVKGMQGLLSKIGIEGKFFDGMADNMRKSAKSGSKLKVAFAGISGLASGISDALSDPLVVIGLIIKAVQFLASIFDHVVKVTNKVGQSLGIAGKNAKELKNQIHAAGDAGGDMFYFTDELVNAYTSLNKAAGMNLKFNEANAKTFQDMTLYMGVSEENAAGLFQIAAQTGKPFTEIYDSTVGVVNELDKATGFSSDMGGIMDAMTNASGSVRFNIKGGAEGLAKAAHTANRLGLSMAEIAAAAETHLDFESSIAKEIEAEMFLQKDLNLDKLRHAAMTGDTAMAAEEEGRLIRENMGALKGNVMAQRAFAAATGISMDRLGDVMSNQERISKLSPQQLKDEKAKSAEMEEQGKKAATMDRSFQSAVIQLKAALTPIAEVIGPMLIKAATFVGNFFGSAIGKTILSLGALVAGGLIIGKIGSSISKLFGGGGGLLGKMGTMMNPMVVQDIGGGDMMRVLGKLGKRGLGGGKFFKKMSNLFGGKLKPGAPAGVKSFIAKQFRNLSAMNLKRSSMLNQIVKNNSTLSKVFPKMSTLNSKLPQSIAQNIGKTLKVDKVGNVVKMATTSSKAATTGVKSASMLSKAGSALAKTAKVLGPIGVVADMAMGGYSGYSQSQMTAEEQKSAGVKENIGAGEATTLGVLTGGAEKGSMFTEMMGGEKGSLGDEMLGVGMAAGRGAAIGAAIGSIIPGVGTAIGAGVGAVVGTVGEGFKLLTDPNSSVRKGIASIGEGISDFASSAATTVSGWASTAGSAVGDFAKKAGGKIYDFASTGLKAYAGFYAKAGTKFLDFASSSAKTLGGWASSAGSAISGWASSAGATLGGWASSASETMSGWASSAGSVISGWASSAGETLGGWASSAGSVISGWTSSVGETLGGWASSAAETMSGWASSAGETLSGFFSSAGEGISNFASGAWNAVSSLADGAKNLASQAGDFVMGTISSIGSSIADSTVGKAVSGAWDSAVDFLGFENGGTVPGGPPYIDKIPAMLTPGEVVVPRNQVNGGGAGNNEMINLLKELITVVKSGGDVYLDGSKVGHALALQSSKMG